MVEQVSEKQLIGIVARGDYGFSERGQHCICSYIPNVHIGPLFVAPTHILHQQIAERADIILTEAAGGFSEVKYGQIIFYPSWSSRSCSYSLTKKIFEIALSNGLWIVR